MDSKLLFAIASNLRRFARGEEAVSAIFTALIVIPLIGVIGLSMDAGTLWLAHSRLSYATDAAALAGGQAYFSATRDSQINAMFAANFPSAAMGATVGTPEITTDAAQTQITVATSAQVPTAFMKMFNVNSVQMNASSTVQRMIGGLQVALVLDVTGSMGNGKGSKLDSMEQGASALLDTVFSANTTPNSVYAAVVPFRTAVNIGSTHKSWIVSTYDWTKFSKKSGKTTTSEPWMGCVEARSITNDLDISDQVPSSDTYRFTPYLYEDTSLYGPSKNGTAKLGGTTYSFDNNWPSSLISNTYGTDPTATGPNLNCPEQPVVPLTTDKTALKNSINSFTTVIRGGTQIAAGLAWGWRVLSDNWQSYWGVTITPGVRTKALVLLTDGQNEVVDYPNFGGYNYDTMGLPGEPYQNSTSIWGQPNSDYTSYGRLNKMNADGSQPLVDIPGPLGATSLTDMVTKLDARMKAACDAIKAQGIVIYTIGYQVPAAAVPGLKACASDASKYLAADQSTIVNTFKTIANQLANLKIVK